MSAGQVALTRVYSRKPVAAADASALCRRAARAPECHAIAEWWDRVALLDSTDLADLDVMEVEGLCVFWPDGELRLLLEESVFCMRALLEGADDPFEDIAGLGRKPIEYEASETYLVETWGKPLELEGGDGPVSFELRLGKPFSIPFAFSTAPGIDLVARRYRLPSGGPIERFIGAVAWDGQGGEEA